MATWLTHQYGLLVVGRVVVSHAGIIFVLFVYFVVNHFELPRSGDGYTIAHCKVAPGAL